MAQCSACKKKGLFLKINEHGRCKACELAHQEWLVEQEQKKKDAALNSYNYLSELYHSLQSKVSAFSDPLERLNSIPEIKNRIAICNLFCETLQKAKAQPYFDTILEQKCDYNSKSDQYLKYAYFQAFDLKILLHRYSNNDPLPILFCQNLIDNVSRYSMQWHSTIVRINKNAEFEETLRSIPIHEIALSDSSYPKLAISNLEDLVKYSKITAKTNYNRIGNFTVIDVETTGLSSIKNEIIEISAIRFEDWTPVQQFHSMVKPQKEIPTEITHITGITNSMVANSPTFSMLIPSLTSFIGKSNIIGYNLPFDLKFIYRNGLDFTTEKRKYYDVLDLAKSILKKPRMKWDRELESYEINYDYDYDVEDHKLTTICEFYGIRDNTFAHRSASDSLATGLLFMKLVQEKIPSATDNTY